MRKLSGETNASVGRDVRVVLPSAALTTIFDECDRFDHDETGGRIVGTFAEEHGKLTLHVGGVIEAGPEARRTAVSFFQDGEYQERVFRQIEHHHPRIEHLGNWHTHHVNGLSTLSSGDLATYRRTVNHHNHNIPFFYALLVTARHRTSDPLRRYTVKHFVFRRGDPRVFEIQRRHIELVETPLVWPESAHSHATDDSARPNEAVVPNRFQDQEVIVDLYPELRPFASKTLGFHWRGPLELSDGSSVEIVVLENSAEGKARYSVMLRASATYLQEVATELARREFSSARLAIVGAERSCNRALFQVLNQKSRG